MSPLVLLAVVVLVGMTVLYVAMRLGEAKDRKRADEDHRRLAVLLDPTKRARTSVNRDLTTASRKKAA